MDEIGSFLLSIIESSADAIVGLGPDGCVVSWNHGAEKVYGYSSEEMLAKPIARLSLPDRSEEVELLLARILSGERVRHFQTTHLKKGGVPVPVSLCVSPVFDEVNRVVGASFIARDLSEQFSFKKSLHETEQRYQKLKSSLELAHQIQETLLPSVDEVSIALDVYAKTLYSEDIGGDYYDFFSTIGSSGQVSGFAVGDVSGHGTGAALLMAMAKGVLQTEAEHSCYDLVALMNRLNQFFCRYVEPGRMMTLFLALIDSRARLLSWCSAGQGPVYIYRQGRQCFEDLVCTGPPLGIVESVEFESRSLSLLDGDILIIGTDGLWEARNPQGEMFSIERVRQLLATWYSKNAKEICEKLLERVKSFTRSDRLDDDTSLMIIKIPPRAMIEGGKRQ